MNTVLAITQIILSVILIIAILIQHSESGLGETFGGGDSMSNVSTRRGVEKKVFQGTIVLAVAFVVLSFVVFVIS
jgi:preprotein translocase subunit SecG